MTLLKTTESYSYLIALGTLVFTVIFTAQPGFAKSMARVTDEHRAIMKEIAERKDSLHCLSNPKLKHLDSFCVKTVAIENKKEMLCNVLGSNTARAACIGAVGRETNRPEICDNHFLASWSVYPVCKGQFKVNSKPKKDPWNVNKKFSD